MGYVSLLEGSSKTWSQHKPKCQVTNPFWSLKRVSFPWVYLHKKNGLRENPKTLFPNDNSTRPARLEFGRMVGYLVTAVCEDLEGENASCGSCERLWVSPDFRWKKWCWSCSIQSLFLFSFPAVVAITDKPKKLGKAGRPMVVCLFRQRPCESLVMHQWEGITKKCPIFDDQRWKS